MKYIEIDGVKYQVDPNDPTKALEVDGEKVLYVEEAPVDPPKPVDPPAPNPSPVDYDKLTDEEITEMAKTDPALAKMIRDNRKLKEDATEAERLAEEERKETLRKNGEFQTLANEADADREKMRGEKAESDALLDKYKGTVGEILGDMMSQIPDDKKSLIPKGSPRKQIEYIKENAKFLGVSVIKKGSHVPKNEEEPDLNDEGKLRKEFQELIDKETLSPTETKRMNELSGLLKAFNNERAAK